LDRYSELEDEDEELEEIERVSAVQKMYQRLFAPDSILLQGDDDNVQSQDVSFAMFFNYLFVQ
jgi:hypothetical protein